jgi:dolichyl-phosphate beta-glucosyltransferase
MILEQNKDIDILIGSRRKHKEGFASYSFLRKFISLAYFVVLRVYGGIKHTTDSQSGIKGFRREAAGQIFSLCETDGWAFDLELLLIADKLGFKIGEMPVKIINHGDSKLNIRKDSIKMLRDIHKIKKKVKNIK